MNMQELEAIVPSKHAEQALIDCDASHFGMAGTYKVGTIVLTALCMIFSCVIVIPMIISVRELRPVDIGEPALWQTYSHYFAGGSLVVIVVGALVYLYIHLFEVLPYRPAWRKARLEILERNEADARLSKVLRTVLAELKTTPATIHPVVESAIGGSFQPFRVEHYLSQSIIADLGRPTRSIGLPNLLEQSSVVFLQNERGDTLRVLLPSPRVTAHMMSSAIEALSGKGLAASGTHTEVTISRFVLADEFLLSPVSHPDLIDRLAATCELPRAERPVVRVRGIVIQKGVAVATSLQVFGESAVFIPSGFFQKLVASVSDMIEAHVSPPQLIDAMAA